MNQGDRRDDHEHGSEDRIVGTQPDAADQEHAEQHGRDQLPHHALETADTAVEPRRLHRDPALIDAGGEVVEAVREACEGARDRHRPFRDILNELAAFAADELG